MRRLRAVPAGRARRSASATTSPASPAGARSPSYVALPRADLNWCRCPTIVDFEAAAALGCRFMTASAPSRERGRRARRRVGRRPRLRRRRLSAVMIAVALGARVIAVDVAPSRSRCARARRRAPSTPRRPTPSSAIRELTGGGAHVSLDALGSRTTCAALVAVPAPRGRHVQVGLLPATTRGRACRWRSVIARELELAGVARHGRARLPALLRLVAAAPRPARLIGRGSRSTRPAPPSRPWTGRPRASPSLPGRYRRREKRWFSSFSFFSPLPTTTA